MQGLSKTAQKNRKKMVRYRVSPKIYDYCFITTRKHLKTLKEVIDSLSLRKELRILDLGCGEKPFIDCFSGMNVRYIGIDFSPETQADIVQSLESTLPLDDGSVDLVIASEVLEHIYNSDFVLREIERVLKKNGLLYVSTPFAFPEHGKPYDFYRYTKYYYESKAKELNLDLVKIRETNSIFTSPAYVILQVVMPIPVLPQPIKMLIYTVFNLSILSIDKISDFLFKKTKFLPFVNSFPAGYSAILKK